MAPGLSSQMTLKRIHREVADLAREDLGPITLGPSEDNMFLWNATIPGPQGSCYEGGVFHVEISLGNDYPFSAPKVTFTTRIYHMNISDRGNICIDILKHNWSPALSLFKVMLSLSSLLTDPNPQDPLVPSIAMEFTRNRQQHDRTAKQWTDLYAKPPPPPPVLEKKVPIAVADASTSRRVVGRPRQSETIMIDDSDEEVSGSGAVVLPPATKSEGKKRKREVGVRGDEVEVIDDENDEVEVGAGGKSKRNRPDSGSRGSRRSQAHGHGVTTGRQIGEVIVIDE